MKAAVHLALFLQTVYQYFWENEEGEIHESLTDNFQRVGHHGNIFASFHEKDTGFDEEDFYGRFGA